MGDRIAMPRINMGREQTRAEKITERCAWGLIGGGPITFMGIAFLAMINPWFFLLTIPWLAGFLLLSAGLQLGVAMEIREALGDLYPDPEKKEEETCNG